MFNKKRSFTLLLVIVMMASLILSGCSNDSAATTAAGSTAAAELKFPEKPVNLVVWGSPGGGSDIFGRTLGKVAEGILGKPIVVENKPGGGGATAMAYIAAEKADGYTSLAVTTNLVLTPLTKGTPNNFEDFDPVIMIGKDATMTIANFEGEFQSIEDILRIGKERTLKWGTFGIGTTDHVAAAILEKLTGITVDFVPFDGGGEAMAALLGGHIDLLNGNPSEVASQIEAEQLRGLGIYSEQRLVKYNDVPTFMENGYDIVVETWRGIVVPKGTPEDVKNKLYESFKAALDDPIMVKYYEDNDIVKEILNGSDFNNFIIEQNEFFKTTLTEMGIM
ncbi:MAG: tripartite tricarboxylate transporter substrate binding protein [Dethiosulfatibacter sp.]|nr:tripartite tricarboxylate transporter substrate binding protein [Dethiosulfatibacter sp.]